MLNPLVSICIPTYCGEEYLRECLDSVLAQTFSDFEVLIVDDQSTDNTFDLAEEYATRDSRIKVVRNSQNLGLVGNWNHCLELAKGEWIKFVFQDDLLAPECLEKMLAATTFGKPIIYCNRNFIFEAQTPEATKQEYLSHLSSQNVFGDTVEVSARQYAEFALKNIGINFVGEPTSVMFHRSVFYQFGSFNPHLIMICDFEFYTRIAIHTGIVRVPEVLASFRVHGKAASAVSKDNRFYRGWVLDGLIFIHDFATNVAYAPIRGVAKQSQPEIDLFKMFDLYALSAWKIARRERYFAQESADLPESELAKIIKSYPLISKMIERNVIERQKYSVLIAIELLVFNLKKHMKRILPTSWYLKAKSQYQQTRV
jgi:glycosyltransferase involved in cell wall biosynthesis